MTNYDIATPEHYINYDIPGLQGPINITAYVVSKDKEHITLLDKRGKAHFTKDYFNKVLKNVSIIHND